MPFSVRILLRIIYFLNQTLTNRKHSVYYNIRWNYIKLIGETHENDYEYTSLFGFMSFLFFPVFTENHLCISSYLALGLAPSISLYPTDYFYITWP